MYVELKHYWSGNKPGDKVEAPDHLAERWLADGAAVVAQKPQATEKPKAAVKPEPEFADPEKEEAKKPARKKRQARNDKSE
jgi:hypothetical protein